MRNNYDNMVNANKIANENWARGKVSYAKDPERKRDRIFNRFLNGIPSSHELDAALAQSYVKSR